MQSEVYIELKLIILPPQYEDCVDLSANNWSGYCGKYFFKILSKCFFYILTLFY